MPIKASGRGTDPEVHRWDGGLTWIAHPGERMRRASHAIALGRDVWVVEPLDFEGVDDLLAELGEVAGVVVLADYHRRDAAAVAGRHDVAVHVPVTLADIAAGIDAPVSVFEDALADAGFAPIPLYRGLPWSEAALHDPRTGTLVATESLVTCPALTGPDEHLAVTPYVRLFPPRGALSSLAVERVLTGHGEPVLADADGALAAALADARRGAPAVLARKLPYLLRAAAVAARD